MNASIYNFPLINTFKSGTWSRFQFFPYDVNYNNYNVQSVCCKESHILLNNMCVNLKCKHKQTNTHLPLKRDSIPQGFLYISYSSPGELSDSTEALCVHCSGSCGVQERNPDEVHQLPLDSEAQPGLELGQQQLHVVPAQTLAENCYHT